MVWIGFLVFDWESPRSWHRFRAVKMEDLRERLWATEVRLRVDICGE